MEIGHAPGDARGEALEKALDGSQGFAAKPMASADDVRRAVASEHVSAGFVVPTDFDPMHGKPIELVIDLGAPPQVRAPLQGAMMGIAMRGLSPIPLGNLPPMVEAKSPPGIAKPLDDISGV